MTEQNLDKLKDVRMLVTGGAGFLGSEVTAQLCRAGAKVTVLDNFSSGKKEYIHSPSKVSTIKGDICDRAQVASILKGQEAVLHLAALPFIPDSYYYPEEFFLTNTMGTVNLVWQSIQSQSVERFVHISTSEVYGTAQYTPMDENHPTFPHSTYAVSKLAAERAVFSMHKEHRFPVVILRPFNTYGPRTSQPYIVPEIAQQLLHARNRIELGNIHAVRDFTWVGDMAEGIVLSTVERSVVGETINLGSGIGISIRELAVLMSQILGVKVRIKVDRSRFRPYDVDKLVCDASKAKKLLKWSARTPLRVGLTKTIEWLKKHPISFKTPFAGWPKVYRKINYKPIATSKTQSGSRLASE